MSSRTRTVLDLAKEEASDAALQSSTVPSDEVPHKQLFEQRLVDMEGIAIYMCVLVECFRINEQFHG